MKPGKAAEACHLHPGAFSSGRIAGNFSCWLPPRPIWTRGPVQGDQAPRRGLEPSGSQTASQQALAPYLHSAHCSRIQARPQWLPTRVFSSEMG